LATSQKSRSTKTTRSKSAASKRTPARSKAAAPSAGSQAVGLFHQVFDGRGHDVWGIACIAIGLVAGLGLYADVAGPVGRGLATAATAAFGLVGYVVPVALVVLGVLLMRGPSTDADGEATPMIRLAVGGTLVALAAVGLCQLTRGAPAWGAPVDDLAEAGGALGVAVGGPLAGLLGSWAAGLVLVAVAVIGVLVITDVSIRTAAGRTADGVRPAGSALRRVWTSLFTLGEHPDDADAAPVEEPAPVKARAPRKPKVQPVEETALEPPAPIAASPVIDLPVDEPDHEPEQLEIDLGPAAKASPWKLPPLKLLERSTAQEVDQTAVEQRGLVLEQALRAHGVETKLVGMVVGPTVTRYELELGSGVKVARVTSLNKDIAYAMAAPDVRILAPIPGRQAIGVEVPNASRQIVALGDILSSEEARRAKHPLEVAIGRDINGRAILANLATMPHVLIAGQTGAGKSSCLNSLLTSILMRSTPDQVRMVLIDPKRVEMGQYNNLPHLLTQVVTNPKKAANALAWVVKEMERRYDLLSEVGFRDINGYNEAFDRGDLMTAPSEGVVYEKVPYILVVIDELADLMMVAARDVEESICRIAQMARAVGIHLVIATQRPSVNVITGVIKANVPARIAFAVASLGDSRVILDQAGAERLVGQGDMLLLGPASSIAQRVQGCWVSEKEVHAVAAAWKRQAPELTFDDAAVQGNEDSSPGSSSSGSGSSSPGSGDDDDDELVRQARELIVRSQLGSTSMLQRKLRIGFARAGRVMDLLEEAGVVGPSEGSKARAVLMSPEELEAMNGGGWPTADAEGDAVPTTPPAAGVFDVESADADT